MIFTHQCSGVEAEMRFAGWHILGVAQILQASGELSRQAEVTRGQVETFIAGVKAA
jgi:hypothetical protein